MGEKEMRAMGDDTAGEGFQCADHPYQTNPGGICAFCLQDRLGKLLSSSNSTPFFPPPSSPTRPTALRPLSAAPTAVRRRPRLPFFKNKTTTTGYPTNSLRRSRSVATLGGPAELDTSHKKSFWSIFKKSNRAIEIPSETVAPGPKVARSRSVGCGSRSFSGDFLERISTGLGDCALRRVESQREPRAGDVERRRGMRCGGIFGGFGMVTSSSYWITTAAAAAAGGGGKRSEAVRGRSRSWGWGSFALRPATGKTFVVTGGESKPAVRATDGVGNGVSEGSLPLAM